MAPEYLILLLYVIPAFLCVRAFVITADAYARLPDRIPVHFDLSGKADKWAGKSALTAYLMPGVCLMTLCLSLGILAFIYYDTGAPPDVFNLALWFFTFSLVYLLYQAQQGIIRYSLQEVDTIWPFMKKELLLVLAASVLMVVSIFLYDRPEIVRAELCTEVEGDAPVDIRSDFYMDDPNVTLLVTLKDVQGRHDVLFRWINPEGKEHFRYSRYTHKKILTKYVTMWSFIYVKSNAENVLPGQWTVEVYLDNEKALERGFAIHRQ